jgi:hypothetical protein
LSGEIYPLMPVHIVEIYDIDGNNLRFKIGVVMCVARAELYADKFKN